LTGSAVSFTIFPMLSDLAPEKNNQTNLYPGEASREMIEAGVFYGLRSSKTHPRMRQYVLASRGGIDIINLLKTAEKLEKALGFLKEVVKNGGLVLLVGTQPAAEESVLELAKKFGLPYARERWPGGILTNFKVISKRIEYFQKLKADFAAGAFLKYTKKERLGVEREIERLRELFEGLENLTREPNALLIIDPVLHRTAVREANRLKIPVIALSNLDADPNEVECLVPGNDSSRTSINWFLGKIETAISEGTSARREVKEKEEAAVAAVKNEK